MFKFNGIGRNELVKSECGICQLWLISIIIANITINKSGSYIYFFARLKCASPDRLWRHPYRADKGMESVRGIKHCCLYHFLRDFCIEQIYDYVGLSWWPCSLQWCSDVYSPAHQPMNKKHSTFLNVQKILPTYYIIKQCPFQSLLSRYFCRLSLPGKDLWYPVCILLSHQIHKRRCCIKQPKFIIVTFRWRRFCTI